MFQLSFPFLSETDESAASDVSQRSKLERSYFEQRSLHLENALKQTEKAEALLREAQAEASKSECRGIHYRYRRMFIKIDGMKRAILQKKQRLDMKIGIEE